MHEQENGSQQVMLGDWNAGPEGDDVVAEFPDNYNLIKQDGWQNENDESGDPFCTWCPYNSLFSEDGTPISTIDHIFVKGASSGNTRRVFEDYIKLGDETNEFYSNMSDHFGVQTTIYLY